MAETIGIVLFNMGGPENLDAVEPFLVNVFSDRSIIELPLGALVQPLFARVIAKARSGEVRKNYAGIGGGSPQLRLSQEQAQALELQLRGSMGSTGSMGSGSMGSGSNLSNLNPSNPSNPSNLTFAVFLSFRYTRPSAADALEAMAARGIRRVVTVPLYPHFSRATTGSSQADFDRALTDPRWRQHGFDVTHLRSYHDDPLYLDAFASRIRDAFDAMSPEGQRKAVILFSAHGLPQKFVDAGDPYVAQIETTRRLLLQRLNLPNRTVLAYQSRTGPVRWIGPGTEETIHELGADGVKHVLIVPLSFVSDHIETLYEIDQLFGEEARKAGIVEYCRPEALNTHPLFIESLARQVERTVAEREPVAV